MLRPEHVRPVVDSHLNVHQRKPPPPLQELHTPRESQEEWPAASAYSYANGSLSKRVRAALYPRKPQVR